MIGRTWQRPSPPHVIWPVLLPTTLHSGCSRKHIYIYINHAGRATYISIIHDQPSTMKQCVMNWHCSVSLFGQGSRGGRRGQAGSKQGVRSVTDNGGSATVQTSVYIEGCTSILAVEDRVAMVVLPGVLSREPCSGMQCVTSTHHYAKIFLIYMVCYTLFE